MGYETLKKATVVGSKNQLRDLPSVRFENLENDGIRVLFIGNSITLHGKAPELGWHGDWGMAASAKENDYVHLVEDYIKESDENAVFCICNIADWEREYKDGERTFHMFEPAREFDADIIIIKASANSPTEDFDEELYKNSYKKMVDYFNKSGKAKIIIATEFYKHPAEEAIKTYAKENNYPCCILSDLSEKDEMKALGLYEHSGVAGHPGDFGMQAIAERICGLI